MRDTKLSILRMGPIQTERLQRKEGRHPSERTEAAQTVLDPFGERQKEDAALGQKEKGWIWGKLGEGS